MSGDAAPPLRLVVPFRCHMRLAGRSPLTLLLRHGSFVHPPEGFLAQLHRQINEIAMRDIHELPKEFLLVEAEGLTREVTIDMRNTQFIGADRTEGVFPDGYETDILGLIDAFVGQDDTFVDVGANWGYMTLHCVLRPGFRGKVVAIEPNPGPRGDFEQIIAACGLQDRIAVLPYAIGAGRGRATLSQPIWSGMASVLDATEGIEVEVRSMDELDLPAASLMKVDIEGSETAFVRGARNTIRRHRPAIVFESRTDTPGGDWIGPYRAFEELGYRCFAVEAAVSAAAASDRQVVLTLTPMDASTRETFPIHLNVLAVPDRAVIENSPYRG